MKEQLAVLDESQDPFGFDIFLSTELFEETMSSLAGLYFQLWFKEQKKPVELQDTHLMDLYLKRHHEIHSLKNCFPISAMAERNLAQDIYSQELREVRLLWEDLIG